MKNHYQFVVIEQLSVPHFRVNKVVVDVITL